MAKTESEGMDQYIQSVGQADFPLSIYDAPGRSLANIARGKPSAALSSIFSPDSLSPDELDTFGDKLVKGMNLEDNPILKTLVEVSTNPLIIGGLLLGAAYPTASPSMFRQFATQVGKQAPKVMHLTRGMHSPLARLRNVPKIGDILTDMMRDTTSYMSRFTAPWQDAIEQYTKHNGSLSKREWKMLGAYLEEWHKGVPDSLGEAAKQHGIPVQGAMAPNLEKKMGKPLKDLGNKLRKILKNASSEARANKEFIKELEKKGVQFKEHGYFHRVVDMSDYERNVMRKMKRVEYKKYLQDMVKDAVAAPFHKRLGGSLPKPEDVQDLVDAGVVPSKFTKIIQQVDDAEIRGVKNQLKKLMSNYMDEVRKIERGANKFSDSDVLMGEDMNQLKDQLIDKMLKLEQTQRGSLSRVMSRMGNLDTKTHPLLDRLSDDLITAAAHGQKKLDATIDFIGESLGRRPRYTMDAADSMSHYVKTSAPSITWHAKGYKEKLKPFITRGYKEYNMLDQNQLDMLEDVLAMMRGNKTFSQASRAWSFNAFKSKVNRWLSTSEVANKIPNSTRKWLKEIFGSGRTSISNTTLESLISGHFYLSTLGGNIGSTSKNALQPILTVIPIIGTKNTAKGLNTVVKRLPKFADALKETGDTAKAMQRAFPEYAKALPGETNMASKMLAGNMAELRGIENTGKSTLFQKIKKFLMMPFSGVENQNRLLTFYGSLHAGKADGLGKSISNVVDDSGKLTDLGRYAYNNVGRTQFKGGPLGVPSGLRNVPAPLRQFMHFPLRYASFLTESVHYGPNPKRLNFGVLGKSAAASGITYEVAKNILGVDVSQGLMFSAVPQPTWQGQPFYPFPFVPPAVGVAGSAVQGIYGGNWEPLKRSVPLMIPGGLAADKARKALSPRYADYKNRTEDGRIPVYNDEGMLKGSYTPAELVLRSLGQQPTAMSAEGDVMGYLLRQRDNIRQYRRRYLESIHKNNLREASKINKQFQSKYPNLGKLTVKESDVRAVEDRKHISRLNRTLEGFSSADRPLFRALIEQGALGHIMQNLEKDPSSIEQYVGMSI